MGRVALGIILLGFLLVQPSHAKLHNPEVASVQKQRAEGSLRPDVGYMWERHIAGRGDSEDPSMQSLRLQEIEGTLARIAGENSGSKECATRASSGAGLGALDGLGKPNGPVKVDGDRVKELTTQWDAANKPPAAPEQSSAGTSTGPNAPPVGTQQTTGASTPPAATGGATPPTTSTAKSDAIAKTKEFQKALEAHDTQIQRDLNNLCPSDLQTPEKLSELAKNLDSYFKMRAGANKLLSSTGLLAGKKPGSGSGDGDGDEDGDGDDEDGGGDKKQPPMMGGMPFGGGMGGGGGQGNSGSSSSSSNKSSDSKFGFKVEGVKFGETNYDTGFGAMSAQVMANIQKAWTSLSEKASASAKSWEAFYRSLAVVPTAASVVGPTTGAVPQSSPQVALTNSATAPANH